MGVKKALKRKIIKHSIVKRKKIMPFDEVESEHYTLPVGAHQSINNSYYFCCFQKNGTSIFFRLGIRGDKTHEVWFAYYDRDGNIYVNTQELLDESDSTVKVECIKPLKEWKFYFNGMMRKAMPDSNLIAEKYGDEIRASFSGVFHATEKLFEFSRDTDPRPYMNALAEVKWSRDFPEQLENIHQVHAEQAGIISGILEVEGKELEISGPGLRDHSYGKREWGYFDRHCWLLSIFEDGANFNANMVRYPLFRELRTGYFIQNGITLGMIETTSMDEIKHEGIIPKKINYKAKLVDGSAYQNEAMLEIAFPFSFENGAYTIYEGISDYTINNHKCRGIMEFGFNIDSKRWTRK